jgi:UDP-glucose 4-epimerase
MARQGIMLVTGGCGFIGSHLVEALAARGWRVRVFDNLSTGKLANLSGVRGAVDRVRGDIRDRDRLAAAMRGVRGVFHQAALVSVPASIDKPAENHDINVTGTFNVLDAARHAGVRRVVLASSAAVYGDRPGCPKKETMRASPASPYAQAKLAGEQMAAQFHALYGLECVALRYFNVYGPRQDPGSMYSGVISRFAAALTGGGTPVIYGDGRQTRDFVFVRDVVQANLQAMRRRLPGPGAVYNIGSGERATLLELLAGMAAIAGRTAAARHEAARAGDVRHSQADIGAASAVLGYRPRWTLSRGLRVLLNNDGRRAGAGRRRKGQS